MVGCPTATAAKACPHAAISPVFVCSSPHAAFAFGLPWLLAERASLEFHDAVEGHVVLTVNQHEVARVFVRVVGVDMVNMEPVQ